MALHRTNIFLAVWNQSEVFDTNAARGRKQIVAYKNLRVANVITLICDTVVANSIPQTYIIADQAP